MDSVGGDSGSGGGANIRESYAIVYVYGRAGKTERQQLKEKGGRRRKGMRRSREERMTTMTMTYKSNRR